MKHTHTHIRTCVGKNRECGPSQNIKSKIKVPELAGEMRLHDNRDDNTEGRKKKGQARKSCSSVHPDEKNGKKVQEGGGEKRNG